MILGVIADDFTGASDIASMLARDGMSVEMTIGVPPGGASADADAAVVALKSRSIPAADAVTQSLAALRWLRANGARQIVFKYCSTFDSTPAGNIGPVGEALARELGARGVVACPALPENGRTIYLGHLFVKGRLLNESGLENHPLNPMTDPDIRRWLSRQTTGPVGLVDHSIVARGATAIAGALAGTAEMLVIVDAIDDNDLMAIGKAVADAPLITGGSGIAKALPGNFRTRGLLGDRVQRFRGVEAPAVVLSGSCSSATRRQIELFRARHPALQISVPDLMAGRLDAAALLAFAQSHRDACPLIYSSADATEVAAIQQRFGTDAVAHRLEALFGGLAVALRAAGFGRIVVAGGETSGAVVTALGTRGFTLGPEIAPGVPALLSNDSLPLGMALKSGNFGGDTFFEDAIAILGHAH